MRRLLIAALAVAAAVPASAQWATAGSILDGPYIPPMGPADIGPMDSRITPTMKRQRIAAATKLRAEVRTMLAENGGKLTREQTRYVRMKAARLTGCAPIMMDLKGRCAS